MYVKELFSNYLSGTDLSFDIFYVPFVKLFTIELIYLFATTLAEMIGARVFVDGDKINKRTIFNIIVTGFMAIVYAFGKESTGPLVTFFAQIFTVCFVLAAAFEFSIEWEKNGTAVSAENPNSMGSRPDHDDHSV